MLNACDGAIRLVPRTTFMSWNTLTKIDRTRHQLVLILDKWFDVSIRLMVG